MHDGVPYGPIQGQGHVALKVRNSSIFISVSSAIFSGNWQITADSLTRGQYLNLIGTMSRFVRARFLMSVLVFCVT